MKKLSLIIILLAFLTNINAQDDKRGFILTLEPQYLANQGLKVNFELQLNEKSQWLVIAPQLYFNPSGENNEFASNYYEEMAGIGVDIYHKFYGGKRTMPLGTYIGYGLTGQFFSLKYNAETWEEIQQNGQQYLVSKYVDVKHDIFKTGVNLICGYQFLVDNYLVLDFYGGAGIRYTFNNATIDNYREYDENYIDIGYRGMLLVGGVKIGMLIR